MAMVAHQAIGTTMVDGQDVHGSLATQTATTTPAMVTAMGMGMEGTAILHDCPFLVANWSDTTESSQFTQS